jgi:hypothetical protein
MPPGNGIGLSWQLKREAPNACKKKTKAKESLKALNANLF